MFVFKMALTEMLTESLWRMCYGGSQYSPAQQKDTNIPSVASYQMRMRMGSWGHCVCQLSSSGASTWASPSTAPHRAEDPFREPQSLKLPQRLLPVSELPGQHTPSPHCWVFLLPESQSHHQHICNNEDLLKCVRVKAVCNDFCFLSFITFTVTHLSSLSPSQAACVFFLFLL